jgi:hypothetical protein
MILHETISEGQNLLHANFYFVKTTFNIFNPRRLFFKNKGLIGRAIKSSNFHALEIIEL